MFTGLIETVGEVAGLRREGGFVALTVQSSIPAAELALGDSVSIDGYCQTVVAAEGGAFTVEISPETLERTTAGDLKIGSRVNLERAMRLSDRLGGHLVAGHVDGVGRIVSAKDQGRFRIFAIDLPEGLNKYVIEKGSVALDGISLTVNRIEGNRLEVGMIPHTVAQTTWENRGPGDRVNVEVDLIGKYVEKLVRSGKDSGGVTMELLAKQGYLD